MGSRSLSYADDLSKENKRIYYSKLQQLNISDPYCQSLSSFSESADLWPSVDHGDIVNYLVFSTKSVTFEQMKAYKTLESHNYFTSGFVSQKILTTRKGEERLCLGEVKHSQSLRLPSLKVWILAKTSGEIISAHCTCVAGMGAACSHIGALLFAIQTAVRMRDDQSCTEKENAWLPPQIKQAPCEKVKNLDFRSSTMKKRKLDDFSEQAVTNRSNKNTMTLMEMKPSEKELEEFFKNVLEVSPNSSVLAVTPGCNNSFQRSHTDTGILNLFKEEWAVLSWQELLHECEILFNSNVFKLTAEDAAYIEKETKEQTKCKKWFKYRQGRITASTLKAICCTKIEKPSLSILAKLCHPLKKNFSTVATAWGCDHEQLAHDFYAKKQQKYHSQFYIEKSGFHIHPNFPHIGATPDALVSCQCCGKGVCEIKCPYCIRDKTIETVDPKISCLVYDNAHNLELDKNHAYYYQLQCQLFVCNADFGDFVVWTKKSIHVERIYPDMIFWETALENATQFFTKCVLPELTACWFTRNIQSLHAVS